MSPRYFTIVVAGFALVASGPAAAQVADEPAPFGEYLGQIEGVWPAHVHVTEGGLIWIYDELERRVRLFDREGNEHKFGSTGAPWFQMEEKRLEDFELPKDASLALEPRLVSLDVTNDLRMILVDANNHRIVCVDLKNDNTQLWSVGGLGTFPGQFVEPTAVACVHNSNVVLVTDAQNHRVQAFNTDGEYLYEWGKHALVPREGEGKIHYPNDIAVAPDGSFVVVAEMFERRVQLFGPQKRGATEDERGGLLIPDVQTHFGDVMAVAGRLCAIWEPERRRVLIFDMGRPVPIHVTSFGAYGTKLGQFIDVTGLAIDEAAKTVYVLDSGTRRIDVVELNFDPDAPPRMDPLMARFVRSMPIAEVLDDSAGCAAGLRSLRPGTLGLIDTSRDVMHELDVETGGTRPVTIPPLGHGRHQVTALAHDSAGNRFVAIDAASRSVFVFTDEGEFVKSWSHAGEDGEQVAMPVDVCVDEARFIYVVDAGTDSIVKYDSEGHFVARFGRTGTKEGELWLPSAVGIDSQGRVVVLDYGNHRGQLFGQDGEWLATFSTGRARTRRLAPADVEPPPD